jgi:hypothetical protein
MIFVAATFFFLILCWLAWLVYRADCRYDAMRREHLAQRARVRAAMHQQTRRMW